MIQSRRRTIVERNSHFPKPETVLGIFIVQKESFIKPSCPLDDGPGNHKAAACPESNLLFLIKLSSVFLIKPDMPHLPDKRRYGSSSRPENIPAVTVVNLRYDHTVSVSFRTCHELRDHIRLRFRVIVEEQHMIRLPFHGPADSHIVGMGKSIIIIQQDSLYPVVSPVALLDGLHGPIPGSIIHDNDLQQTVCLLPQKRFHARRIIP